MMLLILSNKWQLLPGSFVQLYGELKGELNGELKGELYRGSSLDVLRPSLKGGCKGTAVNEFRLRFIAKDPL